MNGPSEESRINGSTDRRRPARKVAAASFFQTSSAAHDGTEPAASEKIVDHAITVQRDTRAHEVLVGLERDAVLDATQVREREPVPGEHLVEEKQPPSVLGARLGGDPSGKRVGIDALHHLREHAEIDAVILDGENEVVEVVVLRLGPIAGGERLVDYETLAVLTARSRVEPDERAVPRPWYAQREPLDQARVARRFM